MERFAVLGLSHKEAEAGEMAHFSRPMGPWALSLKKALGVSELLYLATCNRVEVLISAPHLPDPETLKATLAAFFLPEDETLRAQAVARFHFHQGADAVRHLFSVACGFDSLVLGDAQIRGQFRRALAAAREFALTGPALNLLGDETLKASRRIRAQLDFGSLPTSVAEVAVQALRSHIQGRDQVRIVLLGAGEMIRKTARRLSGWRRARLHFVNRTTAHAEALAKEFGGSAEPLADFQRNPSDFDVLISGTAAPEPLLTTEDLSRLDPPASPRLLLDMGLPPDLDPALGRVPGFHRLDILELSRRSDGARQQAEILVGQARPHLEEAFHKFQRRLIQRDLGPAAERLRRQVEERARIELRRWLQGPLSHLSEKDRGAVERLTERLAQQTVQVPLHDMRHLLAECSCGGAVRAALAGEPSRTGAGR